MYVTASLLPPHEYCTGVKNARRQNIARAGGRQRPGAAPAGVRPSRAGGPPAGAREFVRDSLELKMAPLFLASSAFWGGGHGCVVQWSRSI